MRTVFLVKRWQHHSAASGYDQLAASYPGAVSVNRVGASSPLAQMTGQVWHLVKKSAYYLIDYQYGDFLAERRVLRMCATGRVDVVHALYGDEHLDLLLRRRRLLRAKLVVTFHLPSDFDTDRWGSRQAHLTRGVDAVVVVSRSQLPDYRRWFGADRVVYIPHGINTERFRPTEPPPRAEEGAPLRLLTVGQNLRDFETMHRLADHCAAKGWPVAFDAVLSPEAARMFTGCDNVRIHHRVPEEELIGLYQRADALLLPVEGATANNAVLESLACGTPVISNALGGMPDYLDEASGWLLGVGDRKALTALVEAMCGDRTIARAKRAGARAKALEFRWDGVVAQTRAVHEAVVGGRPPAGAVPE